MAINIVSVLVDIYQQENTLASVLAESYYLETNTKKENRFRVGEFLECFQKAQYEGFLEEKFESFTTFDRIEFVFFVLVFGSFVTIYSTPGGILFLCQSFYSCSIRIIRFPFAQLSRFTDQFPWPANYFLFVTVLNLVLSSFSLGLLIKSLNVIFGMAIYIADEIGIPTSGLLWAFEKVSQTVFGTVFFVSGLPGIHQLVEFCSSEKFKNHLIFLVKQSSSKKLQFSQIARNELGLPENNQPSSEVHLDESFKEPPNSSLVRTVGKDLFDYTYRAALIMLAGFIVTQSTSIGGAGCVAVYSYLSQYIRPQNQEILGDEYSDEDLT